MKGKYYSGDHSTIYYKKDMNVQRCSKLKDKLLVLYLYIKHNDENVRVQ